MLSVWSCARVILVLDCGVWGVGVIINVISYSFHLVRFDSPRVDLSKECQLTFTAPFFNAWYTTEPCTYNSVGSITAGLRLQ